MKQIHQSPFVREFNGTRTSVEFLSKILFLPILLMLASMYAAPAAVLPAGFAESRLAYGLDPTSFEIAPDGRAFIVEKKGQIRIIKNGVLLSTPFLTLAVDNYNEKGLQGITFDPGFSSNGYIYLYYTVAGANRNRISRFTASGDIAVPGSERVILDLDPLAGSIHNGGAMFFKGGKLFVATGDGGDYRLSQSMGSLQGKMLRINPDGSIPADNPFYNSVTGVFRAIWATGLRNPFKAAVQQGTGRIFINDVGGANFEEINEGIAGRNYGWAVIEGPRRLNQTAPTNYADPFFSYPHTNGCAITGGAFYNPANQQFPAGYAGLYFYSDYCQGYIRTINPVTKATGNFATGINRPVDIKTAPDGSMYYLARGGIGGGSRTDNTSSSNGELWRITFTGSQAPVISAQPANQSVSLGGTATFTVAASGGAPFFYQWQRNGVNIAGATTSSYSVSNAQLTDHQATFRVVVRNSSGNVTSNSATLTVINNQAPTAVISTPVAGARYNAGQTIHFAGSGTDPEDGTLPASAFTWWVDFYHDDSGLHTHPAVPPVSGRTSGSFQVPLSVHGFKVWYRIYLKVTDSKGQSMTTYREIYPNTSTYTITSNPAGLQLLLDGETIVTPHSYTITAGVVQTVAPVSPQTLNGITYQFSSWSDNGTASHSITIPPVNSTLNATFTTTGTALLRTPENPANTAAGLDYQYYHGAWNNLPDFNGLTPQKTGTAGNFLLTDKMRADHYGFRFRGFVDVPSDGTYTFYTNSDDGSRLHIGNTLVVDNGGLHPPRERSGTIGLKAGRHAVTVTYFEATGGEVLSVSYAGPGISKRLIPASALFRSGSSTGTPFGITLEAELAARSGVIVSAAHGGFTGTGFGDYVNLNEDFIEWTANVPAAGNYILTFRYALGSSDTRPLEVRVNGTPVQSGLAFPGTNSWANWGDISISANLRAGVNLIRATATGTSGPNIDHLRLSSATGGRLASSESRNNAGPMPAGVRIYPVPANDELTIITPDAEAAQVSITGPQGIPFRAVITERRSDRIIMSVKELKSGFYLLTIKTSYGNVTERVIVQR